MINENKIFDKNEDPNSFPIKIANQEIKFSLVSDNEEKSDLTIFTDDFNNINQIREKLIEFLQTNNWFFKDYWLNKGKPKEKLLLESDNSNLEIYNYYNKLSDDQIEELKKVISIFTNIKEMKPLSEVKYILIDDLQLKNPYDNEDMNGYGVNNDAAIKLYPAALNKLHHRVPNTSNLSGTLIHELAHSLSISIKNKWAKSFSWELLEKPIKTKGGVYKYYKVKSPERCISEYAKFHPHEDLCDSLVAAIMCPNLLDKERLKFIKNNILNDRKNQKAVNINRDEHNSLPRLNKNFNFKLKNGIKITIK